TPQEVAAFIKEVYREDLKVVLLHNKSDLSSEKGQNFDNDLRSALEAENNVTLLSISAREKVGIEERKNELIDYVEGLKQSDNVVVITNARQHEALVRPVDFVRRVKDAVSQNYNTELLAYELRYALEYLGEIAGEFPNDEVLGNIFSKFCIGK